MLEAPYLKWIKASYRNYGSDEWFFLRELAQNSRDAGARTIQVTTKNDNHNLETLIVSDDGTGMSFSQAKKYLFRLYASSKTEEKYSAGMYGIGFWTIFRYNPQIIIIESSTKKESWAIQMDSELNIKKIPCTLIQAGTRIQLIRNSKYHDYSDFQKKVEASLSHYCRFLRRNDQKASPLIVTFNNKMITQPFFLPGIITKKFHRGPVEGVVGFDHQPRVTLLARGLPVWEGTTLDELFHVPKETVEFSGIGQGLAPVFLLNGNNLDVNMSRRTVMENKALAKVTRIAENELFNLVRIHAHRVYPKYRFFYIWDCIKKIFRKLGRTFWTRVLLLLLILIPLEIFILNNFVFKTSALTNKIFVKTNPLLRFDQNVYEGATVSTFNEPAILQMTFSPEKDLWFKIFSAEEYDFKKGFIRSGDQDYFTADIRSNCRGEKIFVNLRIKRGGTIMLPCPTGFRIESCSISTSSSIHTGSQINSSGETIINTARNGDLIRYLCCPQQIETISARERIKLTKLPERLIIPVSLSRELQSPDLTRIEDKIQRALDLTQALMRYDISAETARQYQNLSDSDWLQKIIRIGKGDCDILNGITAVFFRKMGIPCRLVIGLVGKKGRILPSLHAWIEYYHQGWHSIDSSLSIPPLQETSLQRYSTPIQPQQQSPREPDISSPPPLTNRSETSESARLFGYFLISLAIFFVPILYFLIRKKNQPLTRERINQVKKHLSQIAVGALLQPGAWGYESNIWYYRIIPTIGQKPLSLEQAIELSKKNKLYAGKRDNPLVAKFRKAGIKVLDQEDEAFFSLITLLPGITDLDMLCSLKARFPESLGENPLTEFMVKVNKKIKNISNDLPWCLWSTNGSGQEIQTFNFSNIFSLGFARNRWTLKSFFPKRGKIHLPDHFMVFNPETKKIQNIFKQYQINQNLAMFNLINTIINELKCFPDQENRLIKRASKLLLKEFE
jgi:hypothetical protein